MKTLMNRRQMLTAGAGLAGAVTLPAAASLLARGAEPARGVAWAADGRPAHVIRASSNENPYGPSPAALQAIAESLPDANKYMGMTAELTALMSELEQMPAECIAIGSGSGELLKVGGLLAGLGRGSVVAPLPTFEGLLRYVGAMEMRVVRVPVDANLDTDLDAMYRAIRPDSVMVYLCNPNNPIPSLMDTDRLRDFVLEVSRERMVFVDEAYHEFVDDPGYASMLSLIRDGHPNIIVSRTASKIHGLAGLRVGFAYAHPDLAARINALMTGQLNILGMRAAHVSYQDADFQRFTLQKNRESLDLVEAMCEELGIRYVKSHANYTFMHTGHPIEQVSARMREAGIMIGRPFPPFDDWARVSMQTPEEMQYFVRVYKSLYG